MQSNNSYRKQDEGFYVYARKETDDDENKYTRNINSQNVKGCVNYMMRYAGRPAMAQSRITYYNKDSDDITWYYEDHKTDQRIEVKETGFRLLEKMIIHIPDKSFRMIRYYGFYNNKCQDLLDEIHRLLGNEKKAYHNKEERKQILEYRLNQLNLAQ